MVIRDPAIGIFKVHVAILCIVIVGDDKMVILLLSACVLYSRHLKTTDQMTVQPGLGII